MKSSQRVRTQALSFGLAWFLAGSAGAQPTASSDPLAPEAASDAPAAEAIPEPPAPTPAEEADEPPSRVRAHFGEGVTFDAPNDRFSLTIRGRIQTRYTVSERADTDSSRPASEFVVRRMRLVFSGHVFDRTWQYYIQVGISRQDMESDAPVPTRDAYITWTGLRDLNVRFGQMKVPFGRQRVVSSSALQFADRSLAVADLNLDRDVGVQLRSDDFLGLGGRLQYQLGVFGGDGRNRPSTTYGLLWVARVQVSPFGRFEDLSEGDQGRGSDPRLALGFAAAYNQNTNRPQSTLGTPYRFARFDYVHMAADVMFKWRGFSLMGEWLWRRADRHSIENEDVPGTFEYSRSGWGYYVQAGMMLTDHFEVGLRWGESITTNRSAPSYGDRAELGGELSWYFVKHNLKIQADYFALFSDAPSGDDIQFQESYGDVQHQGRVQFQLYF